MAETESVDLPAVLAGPAVFLDGFAAPLFPGLSVQERVKYNAVVTFSPNEKRLTFEWSFKHPGGAGDTRADVVDVAFVPTFVCERAAHSPVLFVGGFDERTSSVVVEGWTIIDMALAAAATPDGLHVESSFTYHIRKERILTSTLVSPIKTAAFLPSSNSLLLFEELHPNVVWALEVEQGDILPLMDVSGQPLLATHHTASAYKLEDLPAGENGYVVVLYPWRTWAPMFSTLDQHELLVLADRNLDGVLDEPFGTAVTNPVYKATISEHIDAYDTGLP